MSFSEPPRATDRDTIPGREPNSMPAVSLRPPPPTTRGRALSIGLSMGIERLTQRTLVGAVVVAIAVTVVGALVERAAGSLGAVTRALDGTFRLVVPLFAFAVVGILTDRRRLADAAWPAARFGVARRDVALGLMAAGMGAAAVMGALVGTLSVALAHSQVEPPFLRDLFISAWLGALLAAAYVSWFSLGATFLERGRGRWLVLFADFTFGASTGLAGAILPRQNAQNLIGNAAPLGLPGTTSSAILFVSVIVIGTAAALRCRE